MLKELTKDQRELQNLFHELDGITGDLSQYLHFLVKRRYWIQQVVLEEPGQYN